MPAKKTTRLLPSVLLALVVSALLAPMALAAPYPLNTPTVGVSDSTVLPGQEITVSGDRWFPGSTVSLSFQSTPVRIGTATVRADGSFSTRVTIPADATPGDHQIVARGRNRHGDPRTVATDVTILGTVGAGGGSAFTGANVQTWMLLSVGLGLVGGILIVVTRRRSRISAS